MERSVINLGPKGPNDMANPATLQYPSVGRPGGELRAERENGRKLDDNKG
jgi:hypothetical protein